MQERLLQPQELQDLPWNQWDYRKNRLGTGQIFISQRCFEGCKELAIKETEAVSQIRACTVLNYMDVSGDGEK